MYRKTHLATAQVERQEFCCAGCHSNNIVYFSTPHADTSGVQCGACENWTWLNSRTSAILMSPYNAQAHPDYVSWRHRVMGTFLSALPPCPVCRAKAFMAFRSSVPEGPLPCSTCGVAYDGERRNTSSKHPDDEVWWLDEVP